MFNSSFQMDIVVIEVKALKPMWISKTDTKLLNFQSLQIPALVK